MGRDSHVEQMGGGTLTLPLSCAHVSGRVRVPPPICSTCSHPCCIWNKSWVTTEGYLSTLSCVLIWSNETIPRGSWVTTVDWSRGGRICYIVTRNGILTRSSLYSCKSTYISLPLINPSTIAQSVKWLFYRIAGILRFEISTTSNLNGWSQHVEAAIKRWHSTGTSSLRTTFLAPADSPLHSLALRQ